ncbi:AAA family ATPase [Novosphingobium album (ex Hu et al. 2023)]|uniref:AAA family ATPase n=1 Tax=Novosphingobium album (ex Hu et al. 2023) TaxID=2930093 RepID=A0ABT0B0K1_9SPHN|nr:AAA family ATPase [Novosphingobium album (ex Hu et al. 2023)]MCJ2178598.1 AAA family ATPase [Novosphingobium album (ex Hu et al. 2023)]
METPQAPIPNPIPPAIAANINVPKAQAEADIWENLGFAKDPEQAAVTVPEGVLIISGPADDDAFRRLLANLPGPPAMIFSRDGTRYSTYRFAADLTPVADSDLPLGCKLLRPGDCLILPDDRTIGDKVRAKTITDLPELTPASRLVERLPPPCQTTSLSAFSLRGKASEFEANAVLAEPLLGNVCFSGQATIWYAPPNVGKTLIGLSLLGEAVQAKRIQPGNVFYINADDSSAGFATKMCLMDDLGVHTLAPGHRGFECSKLSEHMRRAVQEGTAKGIFIVIDTLKKFADLMNKAQSTAFADTCRLFVMSGGTVLAFAHTNKNATATGKLTYTGTADILQDFDAAYIMTPIENADSKTDRVVRFDAIKRRGSGIERTAYRYAAEDGISYEERLVSVQEVHPDLLDEFEHVEMEREDADVIEAVKVVIGKGTDKKMQLAKAVSRRIQVSERRVLRVLEAYTGVDPKRHHWTYAVKGRGAKVYMPLPRPEVEAPPAAD